MITQLVIGLSKQTNLKNPQQINFIENLKTKKMEQ